MSKFASKSCKDLHEVQLTTISKQPDPPTLSRITQGHGHFPNKVKLDKQGGVIHSIHILTAYPVQDCGRGWEAIKGISWLNFQISQSRFLNKRFSSNS